MLTIVTPADPDRRARTITALSEAADGAIWAGTRKDVYRLDDARGHPSLRRVEIGLPNDFPDERDIVDLLEDEDGSLWIATQAGLYRRWPDGRAVRYTVNDGLPAQFFSDLYEDNEKHFWAATQRAAFLVSLRWRARDRREHHDGGWAGRQLGDMSLQSLIAGYGPGLRRGFRKSFLMPDQHQVVRAPTALATASLIPPSSRWPKTWRATSGSARVIPAL